MAAITKGDEALHTLFLFALFDVNDSGWIERDDVLLVLRSTERRVSSDQIVQLVDKLFEADRGGWGAEPRANFKTFHAWCATLPTLPTLRRLWVLSLTTATCR